MLEGRFELVLANAAHIRNVPGRKSDVNDAVWISDLLAHGLIRSELCAASPDPRAARPDTNENTTDPRACATHSAYPEDPRGRQHQARVGDLGHCAAERAAHSESQIIAGETNAMLDSPNSDTTRLEVFLVRTCRCTRRSRDNASSISFIDHHLGLIEELERAHLRFRRSDRRGACTLRDTVGVGRGRRR